MLKSWAACDVCMSVLNFRATLYVSTLFAVQDSGFWWETKWCDRHDIIEKKRLQQ